MQLESPMVGYSGVGDAPWLVCLLWREQPGMVTSSFPGSLGKKAGLQELLAPTGFLVKSFLLSLSRASFNLSMKIGTGNSKNHWANMKNHHLCSVQQTMYFE